MGTWIQHRPSIAWNHCNNMLIYATLMWQAHGHICVNTGPGGSGFGLHVKSEGNSTSDDQWTANPICYFVQFTLYLLFVYGMHNPRPGSGPRTCYIYISEPRSRLRNTTSFSWMTEILWMNLNFVELLTILQLIAIRNSSDGNNIKPQALEKQ